jgi:hypothetical protein
MKIPLLLTLAGGLLAFAGCSIVRDSTPVPQGASIRKIYVQDNPEVAMRAFAPEVATQLRELGFESEVYTGERPKQAECYMELDANWSWDVALYLSYFHATLYRDGRVLGAAEYDSRMGGFRVFSKFGHAATKIRPLLAQMLQNVSRPGRGTAPALGSNP